jgi:hypothetical protein
MPGTFSKRHGYGPCAQEPILEDAPKKLRIGLWNIIQDYVRQNNLSDYESLYLKLTSFFRLEREENINFFQKIEYFILNKLSWNDIFDLVEFLFTQVVYCDYDEEEERWRTFPEHVGEIRYSYTVEINNLLSKENIGWRLKKGKLEREGSEFLEKETVRVVREILKHPNFVGPNNQFNKAIEFFSKRPKPDLENCVKEAVGALEGVVRILLDDKNITLGEAVKKLLKVGKIRKPFNKIFDTLFGFASNEPGSRHGAFKLSEIDIGEAEFVLYNSASCMLFLCKKFGYKPIEEKPEAPEIEKYPDFPVEEASLGEEKPSEEDFPNGEFEK